MVGKLLGSLHGFDMATAPFGMRTMSCAHDAQFWQTNMSMVQNAGKLKA